MKLVGPNLHLQTPPSPVLLDPSSQSKSSLGNLHSGGLEVENNRTSNIGVMKPNSFSVQYPLSHQPCASSGWLVLFFSCCSVSSLSCWHRFVGAPHAPGQHLGALRPDTASWHRRTPQGMVHPKSHHCLGHRERTCDNLKYLSNLSVQSPGIQLAAQYGQWSPDV